MDDALFVRRFQRLGNLLRDRQRLVEWHRTARDALRQIVALDELHHQRAQAAALFESVDRRDLRMVQRREDLGFTGKSREAVGVVGDRVGQDFERDLATELRVARPIDLPHAAFADLGGDLVDAETGAGKEGQTALGLYGRDSRTVAPP